VPIELTRPVQHRWADPRFGERRRPMQVLPAVTAEVSPDQVLVKPDGGTTVKVAVRILGETHGRLSLAGGPAVAAVGNAKQTVTLVSPPLKEATDMPLLLDGRPLSTLHELAYDHVTPRYWLSPARVRLVPVTAKVARGLKVGYVPSPQDDTLTALGRLGLAPRVLDAAALEDGKLDDLDTIVVASRAYETNQALRRNAARLLDWTREGGTLVVMYQKDAFAASGFAPYPLTFTTPADRVTDETAAVTLLRPRHPLLTTPNRLEASDFEGWVQERGLNFAHTWDEHYQPLLSCHDPGEAAADGGLLATRLGQGRYVYCGYALFRQLPAGVPGGYRLLANLVSWGQ